MLVRTSLIILFAGLFDSSSAKLPSYISVCKRNDPKIDQCIINSINGLRSTLIKGIPELNVPTLDPLRVEKMDFSRGPNMKAIGTGIEVTGASEFQIDSLKSDIENMKFEFQVKIPHINVKCNYEIKMKIMAMQLEGNGPLQSNNTDIFVGAILQGHKFQKGKETKIKFDSLIMNIVWRDFSIRLDNLFNGNKAMGDAVNIALNENKNEMIQIISPFLEKLLAKLFLDNANKITENLSYDQLFPKN